MKILRLDQISYETWLPLWQGYQQFYQVQLSEALSQLTWQRLTSAEPTHMYGFALQLDEHIVGIVHVNEHSSTWTEKPYAYLQDLYVVPEKRSQGCARALIEHVYAHCLLHCDRVYWLTQESNTRARILYDRIARATGFIQYRSP